MSPVGTAAQESPESRLLGAGFSRRLELWVSPDGERAMNLEDAVAALDSGEIQPGGPTIAFPATGVRAFPEEMVERMLNPPPPPTPPWLEPLAELVAEIVVRKLKPVIRAEVRKGKP
jgi:hypothetical protein